ncbi:potassium-transporting ATPase A chain domain protein [Mycobacterium avium subsp. avium 2285 (R)]|nr:potassium-transporting ATPase A chain domain protein [Mycobacterium avium subsp. avium 2285 (R)]
MALGGFPEYACQLVLVTKLTAVFHASEGVILVAGSCRCSGSLPCTSCSTNRKMMLTEENANTPRA